MTIEIKVPDIGTDAVEITEILVKLEDKVELEQSLITVEGDKASMEIPSSSEGIVKEIKVNIGDKVSTGSVIMVFEPVDSDLDRDVKKQNLTITTKSKKFEDLTEKNSYVHATPFIRRLAREFGVNLEKVEGTGHKGRILREDIQNYVKNSLKRSEISSAAFVDSSVLDRLSWPKVDFSKFGEIEEIELNRIQKISGKNLSRNWMMIPHVTHFDKTDITDLERFRKQQNSKAENRDLNVKFTLLAFVMKATAVALERMPRFNSSLSEDNQSLILKKYINISIAVDTPNGLVVPVFKDVNKKSITELSRELIFISKKARDEKLTTGEIQGGCFTISSIGNLGTTYFAPIVNAPEVAILGLSKSTIEPVWNGKKFTPRLIMPISLSFDHRAIDGADGARFLTIIKNMLSDIRCLIM